MAKIAPLLVAFAVFGGTIFLVPLQAGRNASAANEGTIDSDHAF
jgi:hypothetical protein